MQQWAKFILVLAWKMALAGTDNATPSMPNGHGPKTPTMVEANCTSGCRPIDSGNMITPVCYIIYNSSNVEKCELSEHICDGSALCKPPICNTLMNSKMGPNTQHIGEDEGNTTVITNFQYNKLTNNAFCIRRNQSLKWGNFIVYVPEHQPMKTSSGCTCGCATITIQEEEDDDDEDDDDEYDVDIQDTDCCTTEDTFCKSTDMKTELPEPTETMQTPQTSTPTSTKNRPTAKPVPQTMSSIRPNIKQTFVTGGITAGQTTIAFTHPSKENQSEMKAGGNLLMAVVIASIVVITIIIILLSFLFIRRRQKRTKPGYSSGPNQHLPSIDQPIEDGNQDRATVSYSGGGDGVVINEYSTIEDHNQDLGAAVYHILEATDSPAPTSVTNDAYAVPYGDAATKDGVQDQEYDTLNAADMHSRSPQQNELGGHGYAVPNKNSKGRKEQDVGKADDTLNAADMHSRSPQENGSGGHGYAVPNKNSKGRKEQDVGEADDTLNAADMHSRSPQQNGLGGHGYAVPNKNSKGRKAKELDVGDAYDTLNATDMQPASKQRRGKPDDAFDDYNMLNTAEVHSKSGIHNVGSGNEYGKLQNAADVPPKDGMYSYVTTEVGSGIVTMPHAEDQTYDKLQRNTELGGVAL